jgi:protein-arginine kinase activator protein McsA
MKCEHCQKNPARVRVDQMVDGQRKSLYLCQSCVDNMMNTFSGVPTQEEGIPTREQTTKEYQPVLLNIAYELTMVKGFISDQTSITQELSQDMSEVKKRLTHIEEQLNTILTLLKPS